jgi:23S rRNA U2552 (ribose-2'-O)-methylase RlmE/FtsJ
MDRSRLNVAFSRARQSLYIYFASDSILKFVTDLCDVEATSDTTYTLAGSSPASDFMYIAQGERPAYLYDVRHLAVSPPNDDLPPLVHTDIPWNTTAYLGKLWHNRYRGSPVFTPPCNVIAVDCEFVFYSDDKTNKLRQYTAQVAMYNCEGRHIDLHIKPHIPFHSCNQLDNRKFFDAPKFTYWKTHRKTMRLNYFMAKFSIFRYIQASKPVGRIAFLTKSGRLDWGFLGSLSGDLNADFCSVASCKSQPTFQYNNRAYCCDHFVYHDSALLLRPFTIDLDDFFCFASGNAYDTCRPYSTPSLTSMHDTVCIDTHGAAHDAWVDARTTFCVYESLPRATVYKIRHSKPLHASLKRYLREVLPPDTYYLGGGKAIGDTPFNIDIRYGRDIAQFTPPENSVCIYVDSHYYAKQLIPGSYVLGNDDTRRVHGHKLVYFRGNNHIYVHDSEPLTISSLGRAVLPKVGPCNGAVSLSSFRNFNATGCVQPFEYCEYHVQKFQILDDYLSESRLHFRQVPHATLEGRLPFVDFHPIAIPTPPHAQIHLHNDTRKKLYAMLHEASLGKIPHNAYILAVGGHNSRRNVCHYAPVIYRDFPNVFCSEKFPVPDCINSLGPVPLQTTKRFDLIVSDMYPVSMEQIENLVAHLNPNGSIAFKVTNQTMQEHDFDALVHNFELSSVFVCAQRTFSSEAFIVLNHKGRHPILNIGTLRDSYNYYFHDYVANGDLRGTDNYRTPKFLRTTPVSHKN